MQTGMNINPDAQHGNPVNGNELNGLNWVRFPFKLSARPNPAERGDLQKAFAQYDAIVQGYAKKGIKTLFVLNQETVGSNVPWELTHNGVITHPYSDTVAEWEDYAARFAETAVHITRHYQQLGLENQVAYEIWNEGDIKGDASVYLKPEHMALVLHQAASAMRQAVPGTTIVFGGLASGSENAIHYLKQCQHVLGGSLPVDAIGIHPYGRYVTAPPFVGYGFGLLADALQRYQQQVSGLPFWITEIGIASDTELGPQHNEAIANYMREIHTFVASTRLALVPVLIWFAWSDEMRNAGVVDRNGKPKPHIYDAFKQITKSL